MKRNTRNFAALTATTAMMIVNILLASPVLADDPGFAACPLGAANSAPPKSVVVSVLSAETTSDIDRDTWPFVDRADVFGNIIIDGETFMLPQIDGSDRPHWDRSRGSFQKHVSVNPVPIQITLFDDDGGASGGRDTIDINPDTTKRNLDLTYDTCSFRIGGDIDQAGQSIIFLRGDSGSGDDRGKIVFKIEKENGRPDSVGDIALVGVDLVQVVHNEPTLVAGKRAVVMVQVANNFATTAAPQIRLQIFGGDVGTIANDVFTIAPPLAPGEIRKIYYYTDPPLTIPGPGSAGQGLTIFAHLDPGRNFSKELPSTDCRVTNDSVGSDPKKGLQRGLVRTENLDLLWCRTGTLLDLGFLVDFTRFNAIKDLGTAFIKGTYPVANVASTRGPDCIPPATGTVYSWLSTFLAEIGIPLNLVEPFVMLFELNGMAALIGYAGPEDRMIGVLPPAFFDRYELLDGNPWEDTNGVSLGEAATHAVLVLPVQQAPDAGEPSGPSLSAPGHEVGHGFGLSVDPSLKDWTCGIDEFVFKLVCGAGGGLDEYTSSDPALARGNPSTGFWVPQGGEPPGVLRPGLVGSEQCDSHCLMGGSPANMQDNWNSRRRWIENAGFEHVMDKLRITSSSFPITRTPRTLSTSAELVTAETQGVIYLSGMIDYQDRTFLGPWYRLPDQHKADRTPENEDGLYEARFFDAAGSLLQSVRIPVSWPSTEAGPTLELPLTIFGITMPFPVETHTIQIWNWVGDVLLGERMMSSNPPVADLNFNEKRYGNVVAGETIPLRWNARDSDITPNDDPLTDLAHSVLLSPDGKAWWPLAYRLDKPKYELDTSDLKGTYFLKIAVTDEANIGYSNVIQFSVQ